MNDDEMGVKIEMFQQGETHPHFKQLRNGASCVHANKMIDNLCFYITSVLSSTNRKMKMSFEDSTSTFMLVFKFEIFCFQILIVDMQALNTNGYHTSVNRRR